MDTAENMSDIAKAYLAEYGTMPQNRDEQDRYSAFRFGYERGHREGVLTERRELVLVIQDRI